MSKSPVDKAGNYKDKPVKGEEKEKGDTQNATRVSLRIKVDQVVFFRRMADHFYNEGYIVEPRFALLAKACLYIVANRYAKFEEVAMANYVQKKLNAVRDPNVVQYQPMQKEAQTLRQESSGLRPPELRRPAPVDKVKEPEWF